MLFKRKLWLRDSIKKRQRHAGRKLLFLLFSAGIAISFPVLVGYRSTNRIETIGLYSIWRGNGNSIVRSDCGRRTTQRFATSEREDHEKLIFLPDSCSSPFPPSSSFSRPRFLSFFFLFSANERKNSGIIDLYVSPPRQYTHTRAQWHSYGRSRYCLQYHYVTKSHLCSEKSRLYRNSVSRWEKLLVLFSISRIARGTWTRMAARK